MRNFENWDTQDLETVFGLEQKKIMPLLTEWLAATATFDEYTRKKNINFKRKNI